MKSTSKAKQTVINFVKETREQPHFTFTVNGNEADAKVFIHRMRVELSRMRDAVKSSGRTIKEFKMKVVAIEVEEEQNISVVTLEKVEGKTNEIAEEIREIFDELDGGAMIQ